MLSDIAAFFNSLIGALPQYYALQQGKQHDEKVTELLECFYILGDLIETADGIMTLARGRDVIVFSKLSEEELKAHYGLIQSKLTIQLQRLQRLGDIFLSNPTIELLDVDIQKNLEEAMGGKTTGLFGLGAGLFFHQCFGNSRREGESEEEWRARVLEEKYEFASSISEVDEISVAEQQEYIQQIKQLRAKYKQMLDDLVEPQHKTILASKAKDLAAKYSVRL